MKVLLRLVVVLATIASTLTVATAAHAATNCVPIKSGTYLAITHCSGTPDGIDGVVTYLRYTGLGHAEIWDYHDTTHLRNGLNMAHDGGTVETFYNLSWNDRTCVEFWLPNGSGGWRRLNNEIDCTDS